VRKATRRRRQITHPETPPANNAPLGAQIEDDFPQFSFTIAQFSDYPQILKRSGVRWVKTRQAAQQK